MKRFLNKILTLIILAIVIASSITIYNVAFATENNSNNKLQEVRTLQGKDILKETNDIKWKEVKTFSHTNRMTKMKMLYSGYSFEETIKKRIGDLVNGAQGGEISLVNAESFYCLLHGQTANKAVKYTPKEVTDIKKINNGVGEFDTNVFAVAAAFADKYNHITNTYNDEKRDSYKYWDYEDEDSQSAIWGITGSVCGYSKCSICKNSNNNNKQKWVSTDIYKVGKALDEYWYKIEIKETPEFPTISETKEEIPGTTLINNNAYKIGPFYMDDYAYGYSESAKNLYAKRLKQDIINIIVDEVDTSKNTNAKINEIMKEVENEVDKVKSNKNASISDAYKNFIDEKIKEQIAEIDTKAEQYALIGGITSGEIILSNNTTIKIDGSDCKIEFDDKGDDNRSSLPYLSTPENYKFPWPNSTFYIVVNKELCGTATSFKEVKFNYQSTSAEGNGTVFTYTGTTAQQPILYVKNAAVKIEETTISLTKDIPLATDITIEKYITSVNGNEIYGREGNTISNKQNNPVPVKSGDQVTFNIKLTNSSSKTAKIKITDILPENNGYVWNKSIEDYIEVPANSTITRTVTVTVKGITNTVYNNTAYINEESAINTEGGKIVNLAETKPDAKLQDSDYYKIDNELTVNINKSIVSVESSNGGGKVSYNRGGLTNEQKRNDPVYVDCGDKVTYEITFTNANGDNNFKVDFNDTLPNNVKEVVGLNTTENVQITENNNKITVSLIVDSTDTSQTFENKAEIIKVNGEEKFESNQMSSSDYYKIKDYGISINKFISGHTSIQETAKFVNEVNTLDNRSKYTAEEKMNKPVEVDQGDILDYTIQIANTGNGNIKLNQVKESFNTGLTFKNAYIAGKDVQVTAKDEGNNTYLLEFSEDVELNPNDVLEVIVAAEVTESNMYLHSLQNTALITSFKNKNNKEIKENVSSSDYVKMKDLIIAGRVWLDKDKDGLMDLNDKNEFAGSIDASLETDINKKYDSNNTEYALKNVVVKLYSVGTGAKGEDTLVRTTKTDEKGLYTFAKDVNMQWYAGEYSGTKYSLQRVPKANNKDVNNNYTNKSEYIEYYIEYEYDGLIYRSADSYAAKQNLNNDGTFKDDYKIDSNAYELAKVRNKFSEDYEIIAHDVGYNGDLSAQKDMSYTYSNHVSSLNTDPSRIMTARSFVNKQSQSTDYLCLFKQTTNYQKPETEYLKYINLGLQEIKDVDISLVQDVYEVKTTINGEEMTYEYNQNDYSRGNILIDKDKKINSVEFNSQEYMTGYVGENSTLKSYRFKAYNSDYNYKVSQHNIDTIKEYKGIESELNVETTYRIKVTNNIISDSRDVYTGINEITQIYDEDFVKFESNSDGTVKTINIKTKDENGYLVNTPLEVVKAEYVLGDGTILEAELSETSMYEKFKVATGDRNLYIRPVKKDNEALAGDLILAEGESVDILITFIVDKEEIDNEAYIKLGEMVCEASVSAYSTYYKNTNGEFYPAGLVDKDSCPSDGTLIAENKYQDNVFKTGINILLQNLILEREIRGFAWNDARTNEITNEDGTQYIGDGKYNVDVEAKEEAKKNESSGVSENKDSKIKDVKAKLVEIIKIPEFDDSGNIVGERIYEDTILVNGNFSAMEKRTAQDGTYLLKGYIPGIYEVRFSYGDDVNLENMLVFNGQDYKSTTYQATENVYAENKVNEANKKDTDEVLATLEKENISDGKDDEIRRLEVISYSETIANDLSTILRGITTSNAEALIENTKMESNTAEFLVRAEKELFTKKKLTYAETIDKFDRIITRHPIRNIDFGIVYRPESQISLNEYVSNVKLLTSDSSGHDTEKPLIEAKFDVYYGIVIKTDSNTGITEFLKDNKGNVIQVAKNATNDEIEKIVSEAGADLDICQKTENGEYIITIAGTKLNLEESIGLGNIQHVESMYKVNVFSELIGEEDAEKIQGFVYLNVDDELLQGATIYVDYILVGNNLSEIDRISENLSELRFKANDETQEYIKENKYYNQIKYQLGEETGYIDQNYSAAGTARNKLFSEYYEYELNDDNTIKLDKNGNPIIYGIKEKKINTDSEYYGRYLGSSYYTGVIGEKDTVAELKIDKILDYVDNDLVFDSDMNKGTNNLWQTTTTKELVGGGLLSGVTVEWDKESTSERLSIVKVNGDEELTGGLSILDESGKRYDTPEKTNLALSVDDRIKDYDSTSEDNTINKDISKYLLPRYSHGINSFGSIKLRASTVISSETLSEDMNYENIAEIVQYSSVVGRVTNFATTVGNLALVESDIDTSEQITLTPPTGLGIQQQKVRGIVINALILVIVVISISAVCVGVLITIKLYRKRPIK